MRLSLLATLLCALTVHSPCTAVDLSQASLPHQPNVQQHKRCIDEYLQAHRHIAGRFDVYQLAWWCDRGLKWKQKASASSDRPSIHNETVDQRQWLNSIRSCRGAECFQVMGKTPDRPAPQRHDFASLSSTDRETLLRKVNELAGQLQTRPAGVKNVSQLLEAAKVHPALDGVLLDADDPECSFRSKLQVLCPFFSDNVALHFLEQNAQVQGSLTISNAYCTELRNELQSIDMSLRQLADCAAPAAVKRKRKSKAADLCMKVMSSLAMENLFPSAYERMKWLKSDASRNAYMDFLTNRYMQLTMQCAVIESELTLRGVDFGSWKSQTRSKRASIPSAVMDENDIMFSGPLSFGNKAARKEYRTLTAAERARLHAALNELKYGTKINGITKYDLLIRAFCKVWDCPRYHTPEMSPGAHWGPAFLPFHREWLKQLEVALRQIDPGVAIPFWDTTLDARLPDPAASVMWTDELLGNGDGDVVTGDFAHWPTTHELAFEPGKRTLYRSVGASPFGGLYQESDIDFVNSRRHYKELTACVDPTFELVHGLVHMFIGGYMADIAVSPNDPAFMMHHTFIDRIWEDWRTFRQPAANRRQTEYADTSELCSNFHAADAKMKPFDIKNIDGLSDAYSELYFYYPRPTCSDTIPNCGSDLLMCDTSDFICVPKVQVGGSCKGFQGMPICYKGICGAEQRCLPLDDDEREDSKTKPPRTSTQTTKPTTKSTTTTSRVVTTTTSRRTTRRVPVTFVDTPKPPSIPPFFTTTTSTMPSTTTSTSTAATTTLTTKLSTTTPSTTTTTTPSTTTTTTPTTTSTTTPSTIRSTTTKRTTAVRTTTTTASTSVPTTSVTTRTPITTTRTTTSRATSTPSTSTRSRQMSTTTKISEPNRQPPQDELADSAPSVWVRIRLSQGTGEPASPDMLQPISANNDVTIQATGLNIPKGYTQITYGRIIDNGGMVILRVFDPDFEKFVKVSEFRVKAENGDGTACETFCFDSRRKIYRLNVCMMFYDTTHSNPSTPYKYPRSCIDRFRISPVPYYTTPLEYYESREAALQRNQDEYLLVQCAPSEASTSNRNVGQTDVMEGEKRPEKAENGQVLRTNTALEGQNIPDFEHVWIRVGVVGGSDINNDLLPPAAGTIVIAKGASVPHRYYKKKTQENRLLLRLSDNMDNTDDMDHPLRKNFYPTETFHTTFDDEFIGSAAENIFINPECLKG